MPSNLSPQEEEAIKRISPRKFHRLFNLPATGSHAALKISYAVAGPEDGDVPTILFCGGMFCTRWHMIGFEHLAQMEGVRIVSIDRLVLLIIPSLNPQVMPFRLDFTLIPTSLFPFEYNPTTSTT